MDELPLIIRVKLQTMKYHLIELLRMENKLKLPEYNFFFFFLQNTRGPAVVNYKLTDTALLSLALNLENTAFLLCNVQNT